MVMYNKLNEYYCREAKNPSLASLLSDMDPNIFSDKRAADPATYNDWYNCVGYYINNGEIEEENVVKALNKFLLFYQQEFSYRLDDVIRYFADMDSSII